MKILQSNLSKVVRWITTKLECFTNHRTKTQVWTWKEAGFAMPAPHYVKIQVLKRWGGNGVWIETGTYYGDTASALAKFAHSVFTIEPSKKFYEFATDRLSSFSNIQVIYGTSEDCLPQILDEVIRNNRNSDVSFWLDGHFSQGETFRGMKDTPILEELEIISQRLDKIKQFTILIDDVRLFRTDKVMSETYPDIYELVQFARFHNCYWTIEADIFIITNR